MRRPRPSRVLALQGCPRGISRNKVRFVAMLAVMYVGFIVGVVAYKELNHMRWAISAYRMKKSTELFMGGHVFEAENTLDFLGPSMQSWYNAKLAKALQTPVPRNIRKLSCISVYMNIRHSQPAVMRHPCMR